MLTSTTGNFYRVKEPKEETLFAMTDAGDSHPFKAYSSQLTNTNSLPPRSSLIRTPVETATTTSLITNLKRNLCSNSVINSNTRIAPCSKAIVQREFQMEALTQIDAKIPIH